MEPLPGEQTRIIRPAAVLDARSAHQVLVELRRHDVAAGGLWNATSSLWQRYDHAWDGAGGTRGQAHLMGSVAVVYDSPHRHAITIYKVTITEQGVIQGWTVTTLCDEALAYAELTLDSCPRAAMVEPPRKDPFH